LFITLYISFWLLVCGSWFASRGWLDLIVNWHCLLRTCNGWSFQNYKNSIVVCKDDDCRKYILNGRQSMLTDIISQ